MKEYLFENARVITPTGIHSGSVLTKGTRINQVYTGDEPVQTEAATRINCQGMYLSPGFIDIHTHGGGGFECQ